MDSHEYIFLDLHLGVDGSHASRGHASRDLEVLSPEAMPLEGWSRPLLAQDPQIIH
jgi:hypothetical protein